MAARLLGIVMALAGAAALAAALIPPHEARWVVDDPRRGTHATGLAVQAGEPVVAVQDGLIWALRQEWEALPSLPESLAPTGLFAGPELLATTTDGVYRLDDDGWHRLAGSAAPRARISHLHRHGEQLAAGGRDGVWLRDAAGAWNHLGQPADGRPVYRVLLSSDGAVEHLRAGSIDAGIHLRISDADGTASDWIPDNEGLPHPVNILSMRQLDDGTLLAGTDQGLYRQGAAFEPWQSVPGPIDQRRVLALTRVDDRLLLGSDDGVWQTGLDEAGALAAEPAWRRIPAAEGGLDAGVAWIEEAGPDIFASASTVYRLTDERPVEWYILVIAGPLALLAGVWFARPRRSR